jgi:hypothetical protein
MTDEAAALPGRSIHMVELASLASSGEKGSGGEKLYTTRLMTGSCSRVDLLRADLYGQLLASKHD